MTAMRITGAAGGTIQIANLSVAADSNSVSDQQIVDAAKRLPDPNQSKEAKIHISPDGTETKPTSD